MNVLSIIMAAFAAVAAIDLIIGNKLGIGKEFEKGISMLGNLALSMLGMIVLSPVITGLLSEPLKAFAGVSRIDPSSFIGLILANDMGGAFIANDIAMDGGIGAFNGYVVASMMGATVSFTLPFIMGAVGKEQRKRVLLGILCGICTIPVGCFVSGLMLGLHPLALLLNLLPLIILSAILAVGIIFLQNVSVKIFNIFGIAIRVVVIAGLVLGIFEFLIPGVDIIPFAEPNEKLLEGVEIIFGIACVMAGAFPLIFLISKLIKKPLSALGRKTGMNEVSVLGFISTLATSVTTFGMMNDMDDRGVVLNSAFAVSAAFTFADHLAFTMDQNPDYLPAVIVGKLLSGICAVALAALIYKKSAKKA